MTKLKAMATAQGLTLVPKDTLLLELGRRAIGCRMVKRTRGHIYQMFLACTLPYFPRDLLWETLPMECVKEDTEKRVQWELRTVAEVAEMLEKY